MKRLFFYLLLLLGFGLSGAANAVDGSRFVLLSSTIGPIDSGIVDVLENQFESETGIRVRHVGAGTGAALNIARQGSIDLVMVHARSMEEQFVQEGFGTRRIPLMYNDFVIVGPASDPAGIRGMKTAAEALRRIAEKGAAFISRGDKSGTNAAELELWDKAGLKPAAPWYAIYEKGSEGNSATLKYVNQQAAYTVIDRATFLALKDQIQLIILVEGDEAMLNYISLIPVDQKKFKTVNATDAMRFVNWLTDPKKGQAVIQDFGKEKYGSPLFFPNSENWRQSRGK